MKKFPVKRALSLACLLILVFFLASVLGVPLFHPDAPAVRAENLLAEGPCAERVLSIDDNEEALMRRLQIIGAAREELIFSTYNLRPDESGRDVMAALLAAAERGVHIRMITDGLSMVSGLAGDDSFEALAHAPNVEAKIYNPVSLLTPWTVNYRLHDKYIIADDTLYMLGGRNTHNASLGLYDKDANMDRDVMVWAPDAPSARSLGQVEAYFEAVWALPCAKPFPGKAQPEAHAALLARAEELESLYPEAYAPCDWPEITLPASGIALCTNPIEPQNKAPVLWKTLCALMAEGQKITVQTPYIVLDGMMEDELSALAAEGREIRLITNSVDTGANPGGCADYLNRKQHILDTGASVFEYAGAQSMHTKTLTIDEDLSVIGSFNFDIRSAYLDTEMMLVIRSEELNAHLRRMNGTLMDQSRRTFPDGVERMGPFYQEPEPQYGKHFLLGVLRLFTPFVRHLI